MHCMFTLIVVDYNGLQKTVEYVRSCFSAFSSDALCHAVIVENGTPEEEYPLLERDFGRGERFEPDALCPTAHRYRTNGREVVYVSAGENLGYAKGNNLGIRIASFVWNDPYVLVSNNDLSFDASFDLNVVRRRFEQDPHVAIVGPRVVTPTGEIQSPRMWQGAFRCLILQYWIGVLARPFGKALRERWWKAACYDVDTDRDSGPCDWVSGCFFFLRTSLFMQAGGFDPNTFLYAEEKILAKRLLRVGGTVFFEQNLQVEHRHGETTKKAFAVMQRMRFGFDSDLYYYRNYTNTSRVTLWFAKRSFRLYEALYRLLKKD